MNLHILIKRKPLNGGYKPKDSTVRAIATGKIIMKANTLKKY